jgi:ribosomal-protein-alanine N-acetyltransferase
MPLPDDLLWTEAGPDRAEAVAEMAKAAFDPHYREAWSAAQMTGLLASGNGWLLIASDDLGVAAFALSRVSGDEAELLLCGTRPDRRRRGLASQMLAIVAEGARRRSAERLFLEVRATNEAAMSLYLANGFRQIGLRPGYYRTMTGVSIDAVTLVLDLTGTSSATTQPNKADGLAHAPER